MIERVPFLQLLVEVGDTVNDALEAIKVVEAGEHAHRPVQVPDPDVGLDHEQHADIEEEGRCLAALWPPDEARAQEMAEGPHFGAVQRPAERNGLSTHHMGYFTEPG